MRLRKLLSTTLSIAAASILAVSLAGCGGAADPVTEPDTGGTTEEPIGGDIIAPLTMEANDLQGAEVELVVGQLLYINTGDLAVDSYSGEVDDASVVEFTAGYSEDGADFNPGVLGLQPGTTGVTMVNEQGGIQPLSFTVTVVEQS